MTNQNPMSDGAFIKRVVIISVILLLAVSLLALLVFFNIDRVRANSVRMLTDLGRFEAAAEMAGKIDEGALSRQSRYTLAVRMQEQGEYAGAAELFAGLEDHGDSEDRRLACLYALALGLYEDGEYKLAREKFSDLGSYSDSARYQLRCIYGQAEDAMAAGEYLQAVSLFSGLGDFEDSADRAFEAALAMTGDRHSAEMIVTSGGMAAESVERAAELARLRASLPLGSLAAGRYHTVYLRSDGSVAACGDNSAGQCDVSSWKNVEQVCAGAEHSVALRSDGTVLAAGNNEYGQCDVAEWKNVVSIACGDYDTLALLSDGTVVSCGYHEYEKLCNAQGIGALFAGSYAAAGLSDYGYLVSSHKSVAVENPGLLLDLAIGTGYTAALNADGSVHADFLSNGLWENVSSLEASPRALLAVTADGKLLSHFFREGDSVDFGGLEDILVCAAGTEHYVFLLADGSLRAYGDNSFGQCDVDSLQAKLMN